MATAHGPRFGVEEEFLLVDPVTRRTVPRADLVLDAAHGPGGGYTHELFPTQIETATVPVPTLRELRAELRRLRAGAGAAAKAGGCRVVGSGTPVLAADPAPDVSAEERYRRLRSEFGALVDGQGVCGCHVHVEVPDPGEAVRVLAQLRPWLPALQALASNSPFLDGRDTGYQSWRTMVWARWPQAGPTPVFETPEEYDATVRMLVGSGALCDRRMVYWHARRSQRYPTVEIRVADVSPSVDGAVLVAALGRGLVGRALAEVRAGAAAPAVGDAVLRAAHWRAARDGLAGEGVDVAAGRTVGAWELVGRLVEWVRGPLEDYGDAGEVDALLDAVRRFGNGAQRQRAAGSFTDVVDLLVAELGGHGPPG
ncbi:hypothetical protein BIV57_03140 [Mangrovactinospora gilvigrisea]|uniref:Putative glutamate--cysteine ligase 2 n=1 Tax=Mangrovactinospora gilvigrisea TaxID=1428644 RepID=A0A1J7BK47_9ACTN|nr:glutamate--cysteine ligase [Mangrovactinospora gilvigrisea]OIV38965.1 hypothetical protein BIV57_03140 [Mangrovactinospora gilvigrisea]